MADMPISLTCADYARVMPLATGEVKPEGIALSMILGSRGSWPARAEMLRRAVQDPDIHGGEWSMAQYLYRIEQGDRRHVGLPCSRCATSPRATCTSAAEAPSSARPSSRAGGSACTATPPAAPSG